ncbi:hypothetical protein [uncultured Alteromonas sp.]|uniref:hypothetical protein n=1 Tax=uncultured Alteromonas sp. TaxID=179113 RepID=UPI0025D884F8|nr:hypothetical protein [uncultured Alteromonas sp.]
MPHTEASPRLIILIIVCLYLPFMESLHGATLWGLNWQSPALMDATKGYLKLVKLVMVLVAAYLMAFKYQIMQNTIRHGVLRAAFVISTWMLVVVQIPMLLLGILFGGVFSAPADYVHREQTFGNDTVYVYTFDPGAMGKAYHYFYMICPTPLGRYQLHQLAKLNWMRDFSFTLDGEQLLVKEQDGETFEFTITEHHCD